MNNNDDILEETMLYKLKSFKKPEVALSVIPRKLQSYVICSQMIIPTRCEVRQLCASFLEKSKKLIHNSQITGKNFLCCPRVFSIQNANSGIIGTNVIQQEWLKTGIFPSCFPAAKNIILQKWKPKRFPKDMWLTEAGLERVVQQLQIQGLQQLYIIVAAVVSSDSGDILVGCPGSCRAGMTTHPAGLQKFMLPDISPLFCLIDENSHKVQIMSHQIIQLRF